MTQEATLEFPNVVDAVRKRDGSLWEIGDALIKECGMPPKSGVHDGSRERIKRAAKELTDLKIEGYGINTLVKIRNIAANFPMGARRAPISWDAHASAGSPEMLAKILERTASEKVNRKIVRAMRPLVEREEERAHEEKRKAQVTKTIPKVSHHEERLFDPNARNPTVDFLQAKASLGHARAYLDETVAAITPWIGNFKADFFEALSAELQTIETTSHELLAKMRNELPKNTANVSHLRVLSE